MIPERFNVILTRALLAVAIVSGVLVTRLPAWAQGSISLQQKSVALVIGNSEYAHVDRLENPRHDASGIASALRDVGFDVLEAPDQPKATLANSLSEFIDRVASADVVFLYYAGHGVQLDGRNYLVPVNARVDAISGLRDDLLDVNDILGRIERAAKPGAAKVIVLDACRNSPKMEHLKNENGQPSRGLARIVDDQTGAPSQFGIVQSGYFRIIALSTAAGSTASDGAGSFSPYTKSLLRFIRQQGLEVSEMFRLVAADVLEETNNQQRPEYLVQTSRPLFFRAHYVTDCDRFAIEGQNFLGVPGVPFDDINPAKAVAACEKALQELPTSARIMNNLARSYEKSERLSEALKYYSLSADAGYPAAIGALGVAYLAGCGLPAPEIERGVTLISRARELGNLAARASLTTHDMLGSTSSQGIVQLQSALQKAGAYRGVLDGKTTPILREALSDFQRDRRLSQRGFTLETAHALRVYDAVPRRFRCH